LGSIPDSYFIACLINWISSINISII
jgi:hypothetical protein